jgi:peroxiredoxin
LRLRSQRRFRPYEHAHVHQHAIAVGAKAPDATLTTSGGGKIQLANLIAANDRTIVVFYRGFY